MSAGNHAQGVAYHAQRLGLRAVIVMPRFTPGREGGAHARLRRRGGAARRHAGRGARPCAGAGASSEQLTFVHPYDDEAIVAGQGTVALEMLEAVPDLDTLVVAVGGGGLIAGMAVAAKALKPGIEIIGVQTLRFPNMFNAVKHAALPQGGSTIAEGIAVGTPGKLTAGDHRALRRRHAAGGRRRHRAGHRDAAGDREDAGRRRGRRRAGGAAEGTRSASRGRKVGLVLGGGNIDPLLLAAIIERGMVRAGRLARMRVSARDVPGSLARITAIVSEAGANIDEVHHQRAFTMLAAQNVEIELVMQTRGPRAHRRPCWRRCTPPASRPRSSDGQGRPCKRRCPSTSRPGCRRWAWRSRPSTPTASRCGCRRATSCRAWAACSAARP